ncbi:thioredoxin-like protein [Anaeromyces robustus]|jgi:thiol-disulfide isomerase/thioredoxin|uniref:Thioredoxin-like protein n=1 Tax=Anaeromyces robustus TaxID=1754192 RepID=A0A1Y1XIJ5_9FUNG|nr:thioredoxin-like protein [Anaeromyces robustus]|eukprot:ORX85186.1 thioredoxin-like protein [Anaeromyces robustus]
MNFKLLSLVSFLICIVSALKDLSNKVDNNVYVATITNYDSLVLDKTKDVFVMFYSPICPFSQKLLPTWEQLAYRYKSQSDDIIFAKFDGSDVDVPESSPWIELEEFPTMVLFKKTNIDKKSYIMYPIEGSRTLANLAKFIEASSTNKNHIDVTQEELDEVDNYDDVTPLDADDEELDADDVKLILDNMDADADDVGYDEKEYIRVGVMDDDKNIVNEKDSKKDDDSIPKTKNDEIPKTAVPKDEL